MHRFSPHNAQGNATVPPTTVPASESLGAPRRITAAAGSYRTRTKGARQNGDCTRHAQSRMVTLTYSLPTVVHP
ncbi:hypothetical protein GCM10010393_07870 [Streptomyces gobitricini]|uniref:Uncharacterized protein n=1 Tax=Streptomyces gobitricini TaxID=68211 RepID=A0ABN3LC26_9ACTN